MTEKEWLTQENKETRRLITQVFEQYDDARLTLDNAKHKIAVLIEGTMSRVYDHGFAAGIAAADLDGDSTEEAEIDFEIEEEDNFPCDEGDEEEEDNT